MTTTTSHQTEGPTFLAFLRRELAPREGRMRAVWRITACSVVIVALGMVFQIPILGYLAYMVFLVSREESAATLMTAIAGMIAATLAVALSLLFYVVDAGEPGLRLPLLALSTFIAMFFARTSTLGPIAFLAGFVLVMSQTLIDDFPSTEFLVRFLLWLWIVVALPTFVTVMVDMVWGVNPARQLRTRADELLRQTAAALAGRSDADPVKLREEVVDTMALHEHAALWDKRLKAKTIVDLAMLEALATLLSLLFLLPKDTPSVARLPVASAVDACRDALMAGTVPKVGVCVVDESVLAALDNNSRPVVLALVRTASKLLQSATERPAADAPVVKAKRLFVADAFTNRSYARFALKTTLAVMLAYIAYSLLDWPGIRTAITTCFFVALGTMAETLHKLSLRLAGAIAGGIVAGLSIVYLLPHMTDIGSLSLLIAVMAALCAWVATSSELLAYAGIQMVFAFYLGILGDYAPTTDLTSLRDRVVGILLGNVLMSLVFSTLWPVTALQVVRSSMSRALGLLATLVSDVTDKNGPKRLAVVQEMTRSHKLASLALFERAFLPGTTNAPSGTLTLRQLDRVASAVFVVQAQASAVTEDSNVVDGRGVAAHWLSETAARTNEGRPPPRWTGEGTGAVAAPRAGREAMACLWTEVADVAPGG